MVIGKLTDPFPLIGLSGEQDEDIDVVKGEHNAHWICCPSGIDVPEHKLQRCACSNKQGTAYKGS